MDGDKPGTPRFRRSPICVRYIATAEPRTAGGKVSFFAGIDRTGQFAVDRPVGKANTKTAREVLELVLEATPCRIPTILTDDAVPFAGRPRNRNTTMSLPVRSEMLCEADRTRHRPTEPDHLRSLRDQDLIRGNESRYNGHVERMNRTITDATIKRSHSDSHDRPGSHRADVLDSHDGARRLKSLKALTPCEYICKIGTSEPDR